MTKPKQHHYVHKSYLKEFCNSKERFYVLDKWRSGAIFQSQPKSVLREANYYSQPIHTEKRMDTGLETFFSNIETNWPLLVAKLNAKAVLSETEYASFVEVLAMTRSRVPTTRKAIEACLRELARRHSYVDLLEMPPTLMEALIKKNPLLARRVQDRSAKLIDLLEDGFIHSLIDPHQSLHLIPQYVQSLARTLGCIRYRSFLHNYTDVEFITGDNPVVIYENRDAGVPVPYPWIATSHFCIYFPITPKICFYYSTKEEAQPYHRIMRSHRTAEKLNQITARFADRFLVSRTDGPLRNMPIDFSQSPVPDLNRSAVYPGRLERLVFQFGTPVQLRPWKYEFDED
jgi:hypothetical protein